MIAEHARAIDDWIGRWNYQVKVQAAEASADPFNNEKRMRPDEALVDPEDPALHDWCRYWWEKYLWKGQG